MKTEISHASINFLIVLPLLIPLTTAACSLLAWKSPRLQRWLGIAGALALLLAALALFRVVNTHGIQAVQMGNWQAPFGITLVADLLSAIMVVLAACMGLAVSVYSMADIDRRRVAFGYYPLLQILLMGVCGAFLTGDLFNLYVWFEVMLMASFVLMALGGKRAQLEGAIKYVTLNLISSTLFLTAAGLFYGMTGTLNMADLALKLHNVPQPGFVTTVAMLLLVSFGIKAGLFPLFFWLPASYHTPPVAVSAIFAGLLTKVGVYALVRIFTLIFVQDVAYTHSLLLVIAGLTMITGVLGAIAQSDFRRLLSFLIISGIGFPIMGLGLFTSLSLTGSVFYVIHSVIVTTGLFLVSGVARRMAGTEDLRKSGGIYATNLGLSLLFLILALSIAGIPPMAGFFGKLLLLRAALEREQYVISGIVVVVSLLTLYAVTKIWTEAFWKPAPARKGQPRGEAMRDTDTGWVAPDFVVSVSPNSPSRRRPSQLLMWPIVAMALMTVGIGLAAEPIFVLSARAAEQLLNPAHYIRVVLGDAP